MVSLEEIVSLVTRGTPRGDFPHGVDGGGGGDPVVSDASAGGAKAGEVDGGVEESKTQPEVGRSVGDGVQEHKQQQQLQEEEEEHKANEHDGGRKAPPAAAAASAADPGGFGAAAEEPPPHVLAPGASSTPPPPPSSWFRNRPDEPPHGDVGGRERPLPAEVRWAFMWLLDSVFFSVKEPVEGLDRHPAVHALLEDLLAVRILP